MKYGFFKYFLFSVVCLSLFSCSPKNTVYYSSSAYRSFDTQIIDRSTDGCVTLKVFGSGIGINDAIDQATKNAVYEVTFKGIAQGTGVNNVAAIIRTPNAREKYSNYFDDFFSANGHYRSFVQILTKKSDIKGYGTDERVNLGVLLSVDVSALKDCYIRDGILKP